MSTMYYPGKDFRLSIEVYVNDDDGVPQLADPDTIVGVHRNPAGDEDALTIENDGTGLYHADYTFVDADAGTVKGVNKFIVTTTGPGDVGEVKITCHAL